ncbi:hypothetical protein [Bacillus massiliigorillae]|uniref:hypothetical protein n=1 Tax=Bacillus massiliigorillae TaxID=1243664 RepID=UPI0003A646E9|nr:hypothetical protein [Bacillus massiliigorillae]
MEQLSIYNELGHEFDPVYSKLLKVKEEGTIIIHNIKVFLNEFGLYEIEGQDVHDCSSDIDGCYEKIALQVSKIEELNC